MCRPSVFFVLNHQQFFISILSSTQLIIYAQRYFFVIASQLFPHVIAKRFALKQSTSNSMSLRSALR